MTCANPSLADVKTLLATWVRIPARPLIIFFGCVLGTSTKLYSFWFEEIHLFVYRYSNMNLLSPSNPVVVIMHECSV